MADDDVLKRPQSIGLGDRAIPAAPADAASGGGATTAYETEAQEENIKKKAAGGHVITMDDLGYMGHFASDPVTKQGHNAGHRKVGPPAPEGSRGGAKRGYHIIPGSASPVQGRARFGPPTNEELGLRSKKQRAQDEIDKHRMDKMLAHGPMHDAAPRAVSDVKMSIRHHQESIANDRKHMLEHQKSMKQHMAQMKARKRQLPKKAK
jgi:hypothetical protein